MTLTDTLSEIGHLSDEEGECVANCLQAVEVCEWCADECLDEGKDMAECIRLCRDVTDIASLNARLMARDSYSSTRLAEVCAWVSEECAEECARHVTITVNSAPTSSRIVRRPVAT